MPGPGPAIPAGELSPGKGASAGSSAGAEAGPCPGASPAKIGTDEGACDGAGDSTMESAAGNWMPVGYRPVVPGATATSLHSASGYLCRRHSRLYYTSLPPSDTFKWTNSSSSLLICEAPRVGRSTWREWRCPFVSRGQGHMA